MSSAMIVTGTEPDGYADDSEAARSTTERQKANAYAATDGNLITLQIITLEGEQAELELIDPGMLLESLKRAVKINEQKQINDSVLVKKQPTGTRVYAPNGFSMDV